MSEHSKIEWTDATWNPLRGCTKISPGCKHCYAETFAERFRGVPDIPTSRDLISGLFQRSYQNRFQWAGPRTVFVNSMSDLFQPERRRRLHRRRCKGHGRSKLAYISGTHEALPTPTGHALR